MKKSTLLRVLFVLVGFAALAWLSPPAFAQRGGGHGGGGFHGGGGGGFHGGSVGGFHGGGFYGGGSHYGYGAGGYRGGYHGGYYGWRGGYGWRGAYWGYPRYGYGWGFGLGFGWPYWWWGYPYAYSYSPWWYTPYPYNYPYSCPPGYSCPDNGNGDPPPADPPARPNANGPARPWRPPVPGAPANTDSATSNVEAYESSARLLSVDRITATPSNYRVSRSTTAQDPALRPEVRNAMRALHEMPPFAREREIDTGRYSHFSAEERGLLRSVN